MHVPAGFRKGAWLANTHGINHLMLILNSIPISSTRHHRHPKGGEYRRMYPAGLFIAEPRCDAETEDAKSPSSLLRVHHQNRSPKR